MGIEQAEAWWRTGCGMCQQNKDGRKEKGRKGNSTEEALCLWWELGRFFRGALWSFTRAHALQISYMLWRVSSPQAGQLTNVFTRSSFISSQLMWPGILHPSPILLILNIPSLAVLENIFARSCELLACFCLLCTNRSLVFSLSLATDLLQLLLISFIYCTFQIEAEMRKKC